MGWLVFLGACTAKSVAHPEPAADAEADAIKALQGAGLKADKGFVEGLNVTIADEQLTEDGLIKPEILKLLKQVKLFEKITFAATKDQFRFDNSRVSDAGLSALKDLGECRSLSLNKATKLTDAGLT
jgi:hypothetical protein